MKTHTELGGLMIDFVKIFYAFMGFVSILMYIPTAIVMYKMRNESDSAIASWIMWWLSSISGLLYATFVIDDHAFFAICAGHFIGTTAIVLIQVHKRNWAIVRKG